MTSMIPGGDIAIEEVSTGEYRWTYTTPGGGLYVGPKLYANKAAARRAVTKWLAENSTP